MPGPGPRGPRQTYRTPCSSIPDSRILARNPRKTGKSRRARGTRTRQPGTRSTRDGFSCGEIASAAGEQRPSILDPRPLLNEIRRMGLDSRAAHRPRARPSITRSTRDGLLFVKPGCKHPASSSSSSSSSSSAFTFCSTWWCENPIKSHTGPRISIIRRSSRHWAPGSDPPASIPEDSFQMPGSSSWHREQRAGAPGHRVIFLAKTTGCRSPSPAGPYAGRRCHGPCF